MPKVSRFGECGVVSQVVAYGADCGFVSQANQCRNEAAEEDAIGGLRDSTNRQLQAIGQVNHPATRLGKHRYPARCRKAACEFEVDVIVAVDQNGQLSRVLAEYCCRLWCYSSSVQGNERDRCVIAPITRASCECAEVDAAVGFTPQVDVVEHQACT